MTDCDFSCYQEVDIFWLWKLSTAKQWMSSEFDSDSDVN